MLCLWPFPCTVTFATSVRVLPAGVTNRGCRSPVEYGDDVVMEWSPAVARLEASSPNKTGNRVRTASGRLVLLEVLTPDRIELHCVGLLR